MTETEHQQREESWEQIDAALSRMIKEMDRTVSDEEIKEIYESHGRDIEEYLADAEEMFSRTPEELEMRRKIMAVIGVGEPSQ